MQTVRLIVRLFQLPTFFFPLKLSAQLVMTCASLFYWVTALVVYQVALGLALVEAHLLVLYRAIKYSFT